MQQINPGIYSRVDDPRSWMGSHPVWLSSAGEIPESSYLVPEHQPSLLLVNDGRVRCMSNICTHKKAIIMEGRGSIGSAISCPIHRWTWNLDGSIRGARGFERDCSMDLEQNDLYGWNGHFFSGPKSWTNDIGQIGHLLPHLDASLYSWHGHSRITYQFNWRIFMEIFLDLYHVRSFHPGLSSLTDCNTFDWKFGDGWSCQTARFNRSFVKDSAYRDLFVSYKSTGHYESAEYGAVWLGIYPNTMIEYYPGCLVVSTVWPEGPSSCINHLDFYYEKGLLERFPEFAEIQQRCFMVTADEDEIIGKKMQQGLSLLSEPFVPMNHPVEEAGYQHFHEWMAKNKMG